MMNIFIYLMVFLLPILVALKLIKDTEGVCYFGLALASDNEKVVRASSMISLLDWPSKMHSIDLNRSQLREYWTIFLHLLGKFKKDNLSDHMNITLALVCNSVSSILIFFVFKILFGTEIGFIIFMLYLTSFWQYYVALYMGHIHLALMFFLLSLLLLLLTSYVNFAVANFFFFLGGMLSLVSFFSSSASRKYPPMLLISLFFVLRNYFMPPWGAGYYVENLSFIIFSTIFFIAILIFRKFLVNLILRKLFNKINVAADQIKKISLKFLVLTLVLYFISLIIAICFNLTSSFILPLVSYFLGGVVVLAHILLPFKTLPNNIKRYYTWLAVSDWGSHFNAYPDKIKTFGFNMPINFKGAGIGWIHFIFLRFMPVIYPLYIISIIGVLMLSFFGDYVLSLNHFLFAFFVSIFPILIHEFTGGLKVGKAYLVSQLFLLVPIAFAIEELIRMMEVGKGKELIFILSAIIIMAQLLHSLYILYSDTVPCRMAPTYLRNKLKELNVDTFYTYDNPYNNPFVGAMTARYPGEFIVKHIDNLSEVSKGIIVIPAISSKSVHHESETYVIVNGDFDKDLFLNELIKDKSIEAEALLKIPTLGASKYYVHESEVTSYRDINLKQISDHDRWLGNAWILIK